MEIIAYKKEYKEQVIKLILDIQNREAGIDLSLKEQPDLYDIQNSYMDKGGGFWIALDEKDEVIGTIGLINKGKGYGILKKFFVRSDYRSKKVGFRLYEALLAFCSDKDFKIIILDTPAVAKASHQFYERNGFSKITKEELPISYEFPDRNSYLYLKHLKR